MKHEIPVTKTICCLGTKKIKACFLHKLTNNFKMNHLKIFVA